MSSFTISAKPYSDRIQLEWSHYATTNTYSVYRSLDRKHWKKLTTVSSDVTEYTDYSVIQGQKYWYKVETSTGMESESVLVVVPYPIVRNLEITEVLSDRVTMTWGSNYPFDYFSIERSTDEVNWSEVGTTNKKTYTDTTVSVGDTYYYRVVVVVGESPSNVVSATPAFLPPDPFIVIDVGSYYAVLRWTSRTPDATEYRVKYWNPYLEEWVVIETFPPGSVSYTVINLMAYTTYQFVVVAYNDTYGESDHSSIVSVTTYFAAPTELSYDLVDKTTVIFRWNYKQKDATEFRLFYKPFVGSDWQLTKHGIPPDATSCTYTNTNGVFALYKIAAFSSDVYSDYSNVLEVAPTLTTIMYLTATRLNDTVVELEWQNTTDLAVSIGVTREDGYTTDTFDIDSTATSYTDTVELGYTYSYTLHPINLYLDGEPSNIAVVDMPFYPPMNLTYENDGNVTTLYWEDRPNNVTLVVIERIQFGIGDWGEIGDWEEISTTSANDEWYVDVSAYIGANYIYRIRYKKSDDSGFSSWARTPVITKPALPITDLTAENLSGNVTLTWVNNYSYYDSIHLYRSVWGSDFQSIAVLSYDTTSYTDTESYEGGLYTYRVKSFLHSSVENPVVISNTILIEFNPPTNLVAVASSTVAKITLTWVNESNGTHNDIYRQREQEGWVYVTRQTIGTSYEDYGAPRDAEYLYTYRVNTLNEDSGFASTFAQSISVIAPPI
jgi:hypothetical protein